MSATAEEALRALQSIDTTLKQLLALSQRRVSQAKTGTVASDRDLDGQYGDPVLRFNPRDWSGDSFKNAHFSQCPPDLLDMVAETMEWFAQQAEAKDERTDKGKPIADYKRQDAARARGWAKRMREGKHVAPSGGHGQPAGWANDDDGY